jgi:hypothetical protein
MMVFRERRVRIVTRKTSVFFQEKKEKKDAFFSKIWYMIKETSIFCFRIILHLIAMIVLISTTFVLIFLVHFFSIKINSLATTPIDIKLIFIIKAISGITIIIFFILHVWKEIKILWSEI